MLPAHECCPWPNHCSRSYQLKWSAPTANRYWSLLLGRPEGDGATQGSVGLAGGSLWVSCSLSSTETHALWSLYSLTSICFCFHRFISRGGRCGKACLCYCFFFSTFTHKHTENTRPHTFSRSTSHSGWLQSHTHTHTHTMGADPGRERGDVSPPTTEKYQVVPPNIHYF